MAKERPEPARHIAWIESARTVAMLTVVAAHAFGFVFFREQAFTPLPLFFSTLVCFAVPTFFCISGYLVAHALPADAAMDTLRPKLGRRIMRLLPTFFAWNLVSMLLLNLLYKLPLLSGMTLLNLVSGYNQLYYIFVLLQFLALLLVFNPFASDKTLNITAATALGVSLAFYLLANSLYAASPPRDYTVESIGLKSGASWAAFFFAGAWLGRRPGAMAALDRVMPLLCLAAPAAFILYYAQILAEAAALGANWLQYFFVSGFAFQLLAALGLLAVLRRADARGPGRLASLLARTGRDTLGIYCSHYAILLLLGRLLPPTLPAGLRPVLGLVLFAAAWVLSLAVTRFSRRPGLALVNRLLFASS